MDKYLILLGYLVVVDSQGYAYKGYEGLFMSWYQ